MRKRFAGLAVGILGGLLLWIGFGETRSTAQATQDLTNHRAVMFQMVDEVVTMLRFGGATDVVFVNAGLSGDPLYIAPLIDMGYFVRGSRSELYDAVFQALQRLTGQDYGGDWRAYFEWAAVQDIALPPHYDEFKGYLFSAIVDRNFERFFAPGVQDDANINLVEVVWGGVRVDGIPSLVNARQISPQDAILQGERERRFCRDSDCRYPAPDELVFGVSINGDNRAYPLRILNWHEMFNDVIGRAPLYEAPEGRGLCYFRAPTVFTAVARHGADWVQIAGESAGCPASGWLTTPETLQWRDQPDWAAVQALLPDVSAGAAPLSAGAGIAGQVPGEPVMLAYCTLCGAGVLYRSTVPDLVVDGVSMGETVLEFGSTGMLMRSNKLMYDRTTDTVWNALSGTPAFGPLAQSGIALERLPVVVSDWATWLAEHPDTSVLSLETGYNRDYTNGAAYSDYFNDPDFIMFPVWLQDTTEQDNKEVVFTLIIDDVPKAYPLRLLIPQGVTHDTLGGTDVVIIARQTPNREFFEPGGASVRAYASMGIRFTAGETPDQVLDATGGVWQVTEDALVAADGRTLPRLPGHLAFWFGWYAFYPDTLVYEG